MINPDMLDPANQLRALELRTPGQRSADDNEQLVILRQRVQRGALERFVVKARELLAEEPDLWLPFPYSEVEDTVETLQIDLTARVEKVYIDPEAGHRLLIEASGNRISANAAYRQAQRRADRLKAVLDRAERMWLAMSPEDTEWKSKALVGEVLDPIRKEVARAQTHAAFCESAFWSAQKTCEEIVQLTLMYDKAAQMGPPVAG